jgi:hypothetical protein
MHKGFDFAQLGGMPLNQQRLEWMQAAYSELAGGLAAFFGNNVIVSGCIVAGNNVSDGWIVVNGELLPFVGSRTGVLDTFLIQEARTPLTFKDGSSRNVQFSRFAQFGSSAGAIRWDSLKRLPTPASISAHLADTKNPHKVDKTQVGLGNLPNAKTDDPTVSDSNILATSKAVGSLQKRVNDSIIIRDAEIQLGSAPGHYRGSFEVDFDARDYVCIPILNTISDNYNISGINFEVSSNLILGTNNSAGWWGLWTQGTVYSSNYTYTIKLVFIK